MTQDNILPTWQKRSINFYPKRMIHRFHHQQLHFQGYKEQTLLLNGTSDTNNHQKVITPSVTPSRVIQQRVPTIHKIVPEPTTELPRVAAKNTFITPRLLVIAAQIHTSLNLRRSPQLYHTHSRGQLMRTSTRKDNPMTKSYHQDSSKIMIEKINTVLNPAT